MSWQRASRNDVVVLEQLLSYDGANVDELDGDLSFRHNLHRACQSVRVESVALLDKPLIGICSPSFSLFLHSFLCWLSVLGRTPLHYAAFNRHLAASQLLLSRNANPSLPAHVLPHPSVPHTLSLRVLRQASQALVYGLGSWVWGKESIPCCLSVDGLHQKLACACAMCHPDAERVVLCAAPLCPAGTLRELRDR